MAGVGYVKMAGLIPPVGISPQQDIRNPAGYRISFDADAMRRPVDFDRAGSDGILTYYEVQAAEWLKARS